LNDFGACHFSPRQGNETKIFNGWRTAEFDTKNLTRISEQQSSLLPAFFPIFASVTLVIVLCCILSFYPSMIALATLMKAASTFIPV
jgi:hypothetical protein